MGSSARPVRLPKNIRVYRGQAIQCLLRASVYPPGRPGCDEKQRRTTFRVAHSVRSRGGAQGQKRAGCKLILQLSATNDKAAGYQLQSRTAYPE